MLPTDMHHNYVLASQLCLGLHIPKALSLILTEMKLEGKRNENKLWFMALVEFIQKLYLRMKIDTMDMF